MSRTEQENLSEPIVIEQSDTRCFSVIHFPGPRDPQQARRRDADEKAPA